MAASSRSMAFWASRCTEKPKLPSSRQTWVWLNRTPKCRTISSPTRASVQSSVAKPCASAPALSRCTSSLRSRGLSAGGLASLVVVWGVLWAMVQAALLFFQHALSG